MTNNHSFNSSAHPAQRSGACSKDSLHAVMRRSGHAWRAAVAKELESVGLTLVQWAALELVVASPGMSQTELAQATGVEGPSLVRVLDHLEQGGWLERKPDAQDRRIKRVYACASAASRIQAAEAVVKRVHERAVASMSEDDRSHLRRLMTVLTAALEAPHC